MSSSPHGKPKDPPVEQDAARRQELDVADPPMSGYEMLEHCHAFTAAWLRSTETLALLQRHFHANRTGCGCGAIYGEGEKSYAEHLQRILAEDVER